MGRIAVDREVLAANFGIASVVRACIVIIATHIHKQARCVPLTNVGHTLGVVRSRRAAYRRVDAFGAHDGTLGSFAYISRRASATRLAVSLADAAMVVVGTLQQQGGRKSQIGSNGVSLIVEEVEAVGVVRREAKNASTWNG